MSADPGRERSVLEKLGPQLGQCLGEQAGHVHLGDPYALGDLGLGELAEEPQQQDLPLARRELGQQRTQRLPVLDTLEALVVVADRTADGGSVRVTLLGRVEGQRRVRTSGLEPFEDLVLADPEVRGELGDGRRAPVGLRQVSSRL